MHEETRLIADQLLAINKHGVLTTNSQPNVNGVSSVDPIFGWGNSNGYIYQKVTFAMFDLVLQFSNDFSLNRRKHLSNLVLFEFLLAFES